jgi:hypothetical protein
MAVYTSITPSDSTVHAPALGWLWVGTAGDVAILGETDTVAVTLKNVPVGFVRLPYGVQKVMATNTTASLLVGAGTG